MERELIERMIHILERQPRAEFLEWLRMLSLLAAILIGINVLLEWRIAPLERTLNERIALLDQTLKEVRGDVRLIRENLIAKGTIRPSGAAEPANTP